LHRQTRIATFLYALHCVVEAAWPADVNNEYYSLQCWLETYSAPPSTGPHSFRLPNVKYYSSIIGVKSII